MSTLREHLDRAGFDWGHGKLVYQPVLDDAYSPGWADQDELLPTVWMTDEVLDQDFDCGFGAPEMPRFYGEDADNVYSPGEYDGSTFVTVTPKGGVEQFLGTNKPLPYGS